MRYRIYNDGRDDQIFETYNGSDFQTSENKFEFTGFSDGIHPYYKKQYEWIKLMLKGVGIILNIHTVPTIDDMAKGGDVDLISDNVETLAVPDDVKPSIDGNTYVIVQDEEMGRGWAVMCKIDKHGEREILEEEHRDILLQNLVEGEWIRSFGIDYKTETVKDLKVVRR